MLEVRGRGRKGEGCGEGEDSVEVCGVGNDVLEPGVGGEVYWRTEGGRVESFGYEP